MLRILLLTFALLALGATMSSLITTTAQAAGGAMDPNGFLRGAP